MSFIQLSRRLRSAAAIPGANVFPPAWVLNEAGTGLIPVLKKIRARVNTPATALRSSTCFWKRRLVPNLKACVLLIQERLSTNCHVVIVRRLLIGSSRFSGSFGTLRMTGGFSTGSGLLKLNVKRLKPATNSFTTVGDMVQR